MGRKLKKKKTKAGDPFHMFEISRALSTEIITTGRKKYSYFAGYTLPVLKLTFGRSVF